MHAAIGACGRLVLQCSLLLAVFVGLHRQDAFASDDCHDSPAPGINWQGCDRSMLMLAESDLSGANLVETNLTSTDLKNSNLLGANLEKATLVRASLSGSAAKGARFVRIEAYRTNFRQIDAQGASFEGAELQRSNFQQAKLADTNFTKADLGRSQFDGADVSGSRFALTNLARADFRGAVFSRPADFDRAFLFLTRIEGVDLAAATGLTQWQLDMACGDDKTALPGGLTKPKTWPCDFSQE